MAVAARRDNSQEPARGIQNAQKETRERSTGGRFANDNEPRPATGNLSGRSNIINVDFRTRKSLPGRIFKNRFQKKQGAPEDYQDAATSQQSATPAKLAGTARTAAVTKGKDVAVKAATRKLASRANFWLIGIAATCWVWIAVFSIASMVFISASAIGSAVAGTEIAGGVTVGDIGGAVGVVRKAALGPLELLTRIPQLALHYIFDVDVSFNWLSPFAFGMAFYVLAAGLALISYIAFGIWFGLTGRNPINSAPGMLLTGLCVAGSLAPGMQILPWLIVWVVYFSSQSLLQSLFVSET